LKKIVLDTDVLIDYVNGYAGWLDKIISLSESNISLILPTIVIAEYFASDSLEREKEQKIADKTFLMFQKQDLTEGIAKTLGQILRRKTYEKGASLSDLIVASTALFLDAELATRNKNHFKKIPKLRFFDPLER
jgi:predicted nucleic acid-binding protein